MAHKFVHRISGRTLLGLTLVLTILGALRPSQVDTASREGLASPGAGTIQQAAWSPNNSGEADDQTEAKSDSKVDDKTGDKADGKTDTKAKQSGKSGGAEDKVTAGVADGKKNKMEQATFGGGCFWCVEAVLQRVDGVESVVSGYAGGTIKMPTYEQVCTGRTGHAEVVQVTFDPAKVSYARLLEIFLKTHDPTTLNRQGHDVGTQYRSIILTHNPEQARVAEEIKKKLDEAKVFDDPIVTAIEPLTEFYPAEKDHQDYYNRNPNNRYCQIVVRSKVEKLEKFFKQYMKEEAK